ncbi:MAG: 6-phosphogluconolactonase [Desulfobulbaceae bacterium]|nr:6-phosphogluconolactonase [Desulfobulbaceae bacterium]
MATRERHFSTITAAANSLAEVLASTMREAISARGHALLAVSGGRTPQYVFGRLRQLDLDWERVTLTLTDERWVSADHAASNEGMVRSHLLCGKAMAAKFISFYGGENSPEEGQAACENRLRSMLLPFDAVYLGTGSDGHVASLFPGDPALEVSSSLCVAIPSTESRLARMSLTSSSILNTRKTFLLFSGPDKHAIYNEAQKGGSYKNIPLRIILSQTHTPLYVFSAP